MADDARHQAEQVAGTVVYDGVGAGVWIGKAKVAAGDAEGAPGVCKGEGEAEGVGEGTGVGVGVGVGIIFSQ